MKPEVSLVKSPLAPSDLHLRPLDILIGQSEMFYILGPSDLFDVRF
jgi:hypothetical protein